MLNNIGLAAVSLTGDVTVKNVFYRGSNGHLWLIGWHSNNPDRKWSAATDLGGVQLSSAPAAVSRNSNRIDVFYVGPNGHLWTSWWDGSQSQWWSAATDLGGVQLSSAPAAALFIGIYVYYRGPDGDLWSSTWDPGPNSGGWSAPRALKTGVQLTTSPTAADFVVLASPGTIGGSNGVDVYYGGPNNHLWTQGIVNAIGTIHGTDPSDLGEINFT